MVHRRLGSLTKAAPPDAAFARHYNDLSIARFAKIDAHRPDRNGGDVPAMGGKPISCVVPTGVAIAGVLQLLNFPIGNR